MKTNLDVLFKTDKGLEKEGIDLEIGPCTFRVKRFGGFNSQALKASMAKHYKPHARQAELGSLTDHQEREIMVKVFVEASMVSWKDVQMDGQEIPYSPDAAIKLFLELPELFLTIQKYAQDVENFKEEVGNA